jgi:non-homologous end joining protein Ku
LKGKKPRLDEREAPQDADVVDLMSRLRASLESRGAKRPKRAAPKGSKGKKRTSRTRAA